MELERLEETNRTLTEELTDLRRTYQKEVRRKSLGLTWVKAQSLLHIRSKQKAEGVIFAVQRLKKCL